MDEPVSQDPEWGKPGIEGSGFAGAGVQVSVPTAHRAQSRAAFPAERFHGNIQERLSPEECAKVNLVDVIECYIQVVS
jgi:hypothetical protein